MRIICATVLVSEALVIFFALLVAKDLSDLDQSLVFTVGGIAALFCVVLAGMLRHRWAYVVGSVLQVLLIAAGLVVPMLFVLGGIFAALWVLGIYLGRKVERIQTAYRANAVDVAGERPAAPADPEGMVSGRDEPRS